MQDWDSFDITPYTTATERMKATIPFTGMTAAEVFDVMGDPERITDWFLLAKEVRVHPAEPAFAAIGAPISPRETAAKALASESRSFPRSSRRSLIAPASSDGRSTTT